MMHGANLTVRRSAKYCNIFLSLRIRLSEMIPAFFVYSDRWDQYCAQYSSPVDEEYRNVFFTVVQSFPVYKIVVRSYVTAVSCDTRVLLNRHPTKYGCLDRTLAGLVPKLYNNVMRKLLVYGSFTLSVLHKLLSLLLRPV